MWVVDTTDGSPPVISQGALAELVTKTKVNAEQDDEGFYALHELKTFTDMKAEGTDSPACMSQLLELSSKTFIKVESDDAGDYFNHLLELVTKTNVELERDRRGWKHRLVALAGFERCIPHFTQRHNEACE
jgi:hypothetical protein